MKRYDHEEIGTILDEDDRNVELGRVIIDYDTEEVWFRPAGDSKPFIPDWREVAHYLFIGAIRYDDPQAEKRLCDFLRRRSERAWRSRVDA